MQVVSWFPKCHGHLNWMQCIRCAHTLSKNAHDVSSKELQQMLQAVQAMHFHNYCMCLYPLGPKLRQMVGLGSPDVPSILGLSPLMNAFTYRFSSTTRASWKDVILSVKANSPKWHNIQEPGFYPAYNGEVVTDLKRFLSEVGTDPKEARYWLKQFQNGENTRPFAVVQVEPDVFHEKSQLEAFASCISFLHRNNMRPVVILGTHVHKDNFMLPEDLRETRAKLLGDCIILTSMLELYGTNTRPFFSGSNIVEAVQTSSGSLCGKVSAINSDPIKWCLLSKHVPVIAGVGESAAGQIVAVDAWDVTEQISKVLQPLKVMKINTVGGFLDEEGHIIPNINLPADLETCTEKPWYTPEILDKIERIFDLLHQLPSQSSVVITSVDKMLQELFTHRGSGTFFKITEPIHRFTSLEDVDLEKLHNLLWKAFGQELKDGYFKNIKDRLHTIYLSEGYSASAIVLKEDDVSTPYLDKFAVSQKAQGEGTGEMLWECVRRDFKQLFWRSKGENPINSWYFKKSEGSWSNGKWTVFWYGILQHNMSSMLIDLAIAKDSSFVT